MRAKDVLTQVRKRLEDASESQIKLAAARQQLLIKRGKVRTASRKVQLKRVDAGDAEATFMSQLRDFVNYHREKLSSTLLDAYDKVERTRDDLGEIEENYLQTERDLTGAEWTFMDQENAFYQFDLHSILPEEDAEVLVPPKDQLPAPYPYPPPPLFSFAELEKESTTFTVQTPPPSSPPPLFLGRSSAFPSAQHIFDQEYNTVVAEVDGLRKDFDHLREQKARHFDWEDSPPIMSADVVDIPDADLTASTVEYFDILYKISFGEAKAQQLKIEEMSQRLPASTLTRRYSDPTHFFRHPPASSTPMRRTQTESAVSLLFKDPTTKEKIREWSLTYLKHSTVQKRLYLNTLEHHGVLDSGECDWRLRAESYWNQDSCSESKESSEYYAASTTGTSHGAESCAEACTTQRQTPSSSLRDLLECEDYNPCHDGATLAASGFDSTYADGYASIPLPPSPSLLPEDTDGPNIIVPSVLVTSHSNDQLKKRAVMEEPISLQGSVEQHEVLGLAQSTDSSLRKDSCHSMDDHEGKKPSPKDVVSNIRTPDTPEKDEKSAKIIGDPEGPEENVWFSMERLDSSGMPQHQHDRRPSSTSASPPILNTHALLHINVPQNQSFSRPISERSENPRSFSKRLRDLLLRSGHRRSKSTSFIISHSSGSEGSERGRAVSS